MGSDLVNLQKIVPTSKDTVFSLRIGDYLSHGFPESNDSDDLDITDFNSLASNFDGDDITDFNLLAAIFAPAGYATSAIPEPFTMLLASLALILVGVSFRLSKNDRSRRRAGDSTDPAQERESPTATPQRVI